jgi:FkbH-like protein
VLVTDLPWLPPAPADLSAQARAVAGADAPAGEALQRLAGHVLNTGQAAAVGRAIAKCREAGRDLSPLAPFRLGVLAGATYDLVNEGLPAAAARHGVALELVTADYDQVMQEALDPGSRINTERLDAVLLAVDHRWLGLDRPALGGGDAVERAVERLAAVAEALKAPVILQTVPAPPQSLFGSYDRRVRGAVRSLVDETNRALVGLADDTGGYLLDVAALAERIGLDLWFDPVHWLAHKLPFAPACNAAYADMLGRLLGAIRGKARKCLVLDLDNTCWGGVIGDDGLQGIKIGQGSAAGEAFLAVQRMATELHGRGVVLAVSSKNDEETARRPFRDHPDMLLKESHLAVFQANWNDKPSNLEAIAGALNIGLDALVLLDDNPAERAQVRAALPMVAVPELPNDPAWYPWVLSAAGYFEAVAFSDEDRLRAASYASNAGRAEVKAKARDLGDYLASLDMTLELGPFDTHGRQRIAQLINKTNQFNLTTRRYTEAEVAAAQADPDVFTLQARLTDRFGDLGMIGVVIARPLVEEEGLAWELDTWLMSCRVLGRRVEEGMLAAVVREARAAGVSRLVGQYRPTAKNGMVADHYLKLGFTPAEDGPEGERRFVLACAAYVEPTLPFKRGTAG